MQELVQHDLPYNLGEKTRFRGAPGIQPYIAYLLNCVLIPELRFADAGERWRLAARVLQVGSLLLCCRVGAGGRNLLNSVGRICSVVVAPWSRFVELKCFLILFLFLLLFDGTGFVAAGERKHESTLRKKVMAITNRKNSQKEGKSTSSVTPPPPFPLRSQLLVLKKVMLALLRRYPLAAEGASLSPGPAAPLATQADEEACRMDFDTKASDSSNSGAPSHRRYKSPGYYILREVSTDPDTDTQTHTHTHT